MLLFMVFIIYFLFIFHYIVIVIQTLTNVCPTMVDVPIYVLTLMVATFVTVFLVVS